MTQVLLTHGYFLEEDDKEREIMKPYPPLGLLYVSAYLRRAGFAVEVFDTTFSTRDALTSAARHGARRGAGDLHEPHDPRVGAGYHRAGPRRHGWTVVLGGPEAANYPAEYLAHGADVVVVGEGEETLAELLPALDARGAPPPARGRRHGIPGRGRRGGHEPGPRRRSRTSTPSPGPIARRSTWSGTWTSGAPTTRSAASTSSRRAAARTTAAGARTRCSATRTGAGASSARADELQHS